MQSIYKIQNFSYAYPLSQSYALENITLQFTPGKIYGIVCANKAGKTTLCLALKGYVPHFFQGTHSGNIYFHGQSDFLNNDDIGIVFDNPITQLSKIKSTIFEEVAFSLENRGETPEKIQQRVIATLKMLNLEKYALAHPFQISGGQMQRLAIANMIVSNPSVLILDEPVAQLDPHESKNIYECLMKYKKMGHTIFIAEQNTDLIAEYADAVIALESGKVVHYGSPAEVFYDPAFNQKNIPLPNSIFLQEKLTKHGVNIDGKILKKDALIQEIKRLVNDR